MKPLLQLTCIHLMTQSTRVPRHVASQTKGFPSLHTTIVPAPCLFPSQWSKLEVPAMCSCQNMVQYVVDWWIMAVVTLTLPATEPMCWKFAHFSPTVLAGRGMTHNWSQRESNSHLDGVVISSPPYVGYWGGHWKHTCTWLFSWNCQESGTSHDI